jgi:hypothetical protein
LAALESVAARTGGQLLLMYGRRRIGKSYLLERFSRGRETVFYQATQQAESIELSAFSDLIRAVTRLPDGVSFPGWEAALDALADAAPERRLVVILDEFPYLCESTEVLHRSFSAGGIDAGARRE